MKARDYLEQHWIKNKIWTHIEWPKHQNRFKFCISYFEGKEFIDIGCALGHSTNLLKKLLPGNWHGLEFWDGAVIKAKKLFPEIEFYYSEDFDFLPVCGVFDSVLCSEVIEHVEDDKALVNGLMNITKKALVVTTPNRRVDDPGHLRIYTREALSKLFNDCNFEIIEKDTFFYVIIKRETK